MALKNTNPRARMLIIALAMTMASAAPGHGVNGVVALQSCNTTISIRQRDGRKAAVAFFCAGNEKHVNNGLHQLKQDLWSQQCEGMNISEILTFVVGLNAEAKAHECSFLVSYASNLIAEAGDFAVISLDNGPAEYPEPFWTPAVQLPSPS